MRAVIVFVKAPRPGAVKTRLAAGVGDAAAVALYRACAERAIREACSVPDARCVVAYAAPDSGQAVKAWLDEAGLTPDIASLTPQASDPDLGVRMRAALAAQLDEGGASAAVIMGSDVPDLAAPAIEAVLDAVGAGASVAFAPSPDGGFYAVAARAAPAGMLGGEAGAAGVPWSTPAARVGAVAAAEAAGLAVAAGDGLASLADIDTVDDLRAWRASAPPDHPLLPAMDAALAQTVGGTPSPPPPPPPPPSLTVTARLFAAARDAAGGAGAITLALPPGASAADAVAALVRDHPRLRGVLGACAVAVNCEVVGPADEEEGGGEGGGRGTGAALLSPGDEVALIPPISGG